MLVNLHVLFSPVKYRLHANLIQKKGITWNNKKKNHAKSSYKKNCDNVFLSWKFTEMPPFCDT